MNKIIDFTPAQVQAIMANLYKLPAHEQAETLELLEELTARKAAVAAQTSLLSFAHIVAPVLQIETEPKVFMVGQHHKRIAALFDDIAAGKKRRVLISIAPRMGKSLLSSYLFPAWYMGRFPNRRMIMASHTADLASSFGRKIRDLIDTPEYRSVFPEVELKADSKAAGQWATNKGGEFYAVGTGGALAGRGANLICILPTTMVISQRGVIQASRVQLGDLLYGAGGWGKVSKLMGSVSTEQVTINGVSMTPNHPVWVEGKGWTDAKAVQVGDRLKGVSLIDRVKIVCAHTVLWFLPLNGG